MKNGGKAKQQNCDDGEERMTKIKTKDFLLSFPFFFFPSLPSSFHPTFFFFRSKHFLMHFTNFSFLLLQQKNIKISSFFLTLMPKLIIFSVYFFFFLPFSHFWLSLHEFFKEAHNPDKMWERGYDAVVHRNFHPYYTGKKLIFFFFVIIWFVLTNWSCNKISFQKKKRKKNWTVHYQWYNRSLNLKSYFIIQRINHILLLYR